MKRFSSRLGAAFCVSASLVAPSTTRAQAAERRPAAVTPHFAFFSDPEVNLNDALVAAGVARGDGKPELFHSGTEAPCFAALPASSRAGWDRAVDYYAEIVSPGGWDGKPQMSIRAHLAGFDEMVDDSASRRFLAITAGLMAGAAPAYQACRWARQDGANRRWIQDVERLLAQDEEPLVRRLEGLYEERWQDLPIPVDVVEIAGWSGASSILRDGSGGHLLISNTYEGPQALEIVFHEASHLLMGPDAPVRRALNEAARAQHTTLPPDFWHVLLFYTTGEAVRGVLADAGAPGYRPIVFDIFERNHRWSGYREAIERSWPPYLGGGESLAVACEALVSALR